MSFVAGFVELNLAGLSDNVFQTMYMVPGGGVYSHRLQGQCENTIRIEKLQCLCEFERHGSAVP
jgi:hypothetical protein